MASERARRVAWTVAAAAAVALAGQLALPGVNRVELAHIIGKGARHAATGAMQQLSVIALGISPLVNAFLFVELAALIVPRWRPLRHGGPEGRRALGRAAACLAVALAALQAYFLARYLEAFSYQGAEVFAGGAKLRALVIVTLVAGTMALAWLVSVIGHRGWGNGYAVLLLVGCVSSVHWWEIAPTPLAGLIVIGAAALVVVTTAVLLGARPGGIPWPASGMIPLGDARALGAFFALLSSFGIWARWLPKVAAALDGLGAGVLAVMAFTVLWSYVFARPRLSGASRSGWWAATLVTMVAWIVVLAATALAREYVKEGASLLEPWKLVLATAIALDLYDELVARRTALVPVWPLHAPLRIADVRGKLDAAGITYHLQSRRLRTLLWFFGPYVPIMVLVPPDRAAEAERLLRA